MSADTEDSLEACSPNISIFTTFRIMDADNEAIAFVTISDKDEWLYINEVSVNHKHRRNGYAKKLLNKVMATFGHRKMYLQVYPFTNQPMSVEQLKTFYGSFGFVSSTDFPGGMTRIPKEE